MSTTRRTILIAPVAWLGACTLQRWSKATRVSSETLRIAVAELGAEGIAHVETPDRGPNLLVTRVDEATYRAVVLVCTHQGCAVQQRGRELVCPCHGSRFELTGAVTEGPAQKPLPELPVTRQGDDLLIAMKQ